MENIRDCILVKISICALIPVDYVRCNQKKDSKMIDNACPKEVASYAGAVLTHDVTTMNDNPFRNFTFFLLFFSTSC